MALSRANLLHVLSFSGTPSHGYPDLRACCHFPGSVQLSSKNKLPTTEKEGTRMSMLEKKSFTAPDETRSLPKTKVEVVTFGDMTVMKSTFEPGWRWSEHVKPKVGTASCQALHFSYVISGRQRVRMDDGTEEEFGPGDVVVVPPGHDAWVVGDEPFVGLDFQSGKTYAR